ncbi:Metallo-hydrolase/oxidoreductase [Dentipellis sp. KUC8613]|nr:Metallo-hydrolase/oxidoreductase [Dentipellis sp. KUC8613]
MAKLESLPSIARLSDRVIRVLGQNPGKFTLQGTNTYLIGRTNPYILFDTGVGEPTYPPILKDALLNTADWSVPDQPIVSDIILSHRHLDHICGLPSVLTLLSEIWSQRNPTVPYPAPRIHKYPLPTGVADETLQEVVGKLPKDSYALPPDGSELGVFHKLSEDQTFPLPSAPSESLKILHTPGHTTDSISLLFEPDRALFTGDTVLGHGTAVFEDLSAYLASLRKMLWAAKSPDGNTAYEILYPAHGAVVKQGAETIRMYIEHRLEREEQIVEVLRSVSVSEDDGKVCTTWGITERLYAHYPVGLWEPAARVLHLHLKKLEKDQRVRLLGGEGKETAWELVEQTTFSEED